MVQRYFGRKKKIRLIVVPESASDELEFAASEFKTIADRATDKEWKIVTDSDADDEYLERVVIGDASEQTLDKTGITTSDGYKISADGNAYYVVGGSDNGVVYGVYGLLHNLYGYEYYGIDNYELNDDYIVGGDFNVTVNPDFEMRSVSYAPVANSVTYRYRLGFGPKDVVTINGKSGHNSFEYLKPATYLSTHPKWYDNASEPHQLCYTAHGDAVEYSAMLDAAFTKLKEVLIAQPGKHIVAFSTQDNEHSCSCSSCASYTHVSATLVRFLNDLSDMTYNWFAGEASAYAREVVFMFYAYLDYADAPTGDGEKCNEHVIPELALTSANYTQNLTHAKNTAAAANISAWQTAAPYGIGSYLYSANYKLYLVPYDTFSAMQAWYQAYNAAGSEYVYNLGTSGETAISTGFIGLKIYLESKLSWDADADVSALTDAYFKATYGSAWSQMKALYTQYHSDCVANANKYASGDPGKPTVETEAGYPFLSGVISAGPYLLDKNFWTSAQISTWRGYIASALSAISSLEGSDPDLYDVLFKRITLERIWVNYMDYKIYNNTSVAETLYNDIVAAGITKEKEGTSIDGLKEELSAIIG